jgi:hypothetical protein
MNNFRIENDIFIADDYDIHDAVDSYLSGNPHNLPAIGTWNTSNVTSMVNLFNNKTRFNENINNWDVSNVENMEGMFLDAVSFNQPLDNWDVSNVYVMDTMFSGARAFNQNIERWNVGNVTSIFEMFTMTSYNQPLNNWDTSNITDMSKVFERNTAFNQPLNNWNVSNVTSFSRMFTDASSFNQPLNNWDVSHATQFSNMFSNALSFDQDISTWRLTVGPELNTYNMFGGLCPIRAEFKPVIPEPIRTNRQQQHLMDQQMFANQRFPANQMPQDVAQPTGVAFEVHSAFSNIDFVSLFKMIGDNNLDVYNLSYPFGTYMLNELNKLLSEYDHDDKMDLQTKLDSLTPKIRGINYDTDFKMRPNPSGINAFFTIINFVKKQEKHYKDNYIKFFINDSYNAYDTGTDTTSCVKGIKERLIFALGQAGYDIDNPLYKHISEIVFPLKNEQLYAFINSCINEHKQELLSIGNSKLDQKKQLLNQCVVSKVKAGFNNIDANQLQSRVATLINNSLDMIEDEQLTGGKKRHTRKRRAKNNVRTKQTMRKVKKRQRIKLTRKNNSKSKKTTIKNCVRKSKKCYM